MTSDVASYLAKLAEIQSGTTDYIYTQAPDEPRILIDSNTRKITIPSVLKTVGVEHDHNAETVFFEVDRYFDNEDLSQHICVIHYINAKKSPDIYPVTLKDLSVDGKLIFGWTISNHVTQLKGEVTFAVRFYTLNSDNTTFKYNWNTTVSTFIISEGLDVMNTNPVINTDILTQSLSEINAAVEAANAATENIVADASTAKTTIDNAVLTTKMVYKEPVATFAALSTTYPNAEEGWVSKVLGDSKIYRYTSGTWQWRDTVSLSTYDALFSSFTSQLAEKASQIDVNTLSTNKVDKGGNEQITLGMLSQEVKTSMTGGSVAVVGEDSVNKSNIVKTAVNRYHCNWFTVDCNNLIDSRLGIKYYSNTTYWNGVYSASTDTIATEEIEIVEGTSYLTNAIFVFWLDSTKTYLSKVTGTSSSNPLGVNINAVAPTGAKYMVCTFRSIYTEFHFNTGSNTTTFKTYDESVLLKDVNLTELLDKYTLKEIEVMLDKNAENVGQVSNQVIGEGEFTISSTYGVNGVLISGVNYCTVGEASNSDDNILKTIWVYGGGAGISISCAIGTFDQNMLLVETGERFTLTTNAFWNEIDMSAQKIKIPSGSRLFMNLSNNYSRVYSTDGTHVIKSQTSYISDSSHVLTGDYSGMYFYESDYLIPFTYTVGLEPLKDRVSYIESVISTEKITGNSFTLSQTIYSPTGDKKLLYIDTDGSVKATDKIPSSAIFVGNSLLIAGGDMGMCASEPSKDYYHLTVAAIQEYNSNFTATLTSGVTWESYTTSANRKTWVDAMTSTLASNQLVIIQLSDNVNTAEKLATFEADGIYLVNAIKTANPSCRVIWVSGWFTNDTKQEMVHNICKKSGADFVDISQFKDDSTNKGYIGMIRTYANGTTETVTLSGVAAHPGDTGMQLISNQIMKILDL